MSAFTFPEVLWWNKLTEGFWNHRANFRRKISLSLSLFQGLSSCCCCWQEDLYLAYLPKSMMHESGIQRPCPAPYRDVDVRFQKIQICIPSALTCFFMSVKLCIVSNQCLNRFLSSGNFWSFWCASITELIMNVIVLLEECPYFVGSYDVGTRQRILPAVPFVFGGLEMGDITWRGPHMIEQQRGGLAYIFNLW